MGRRCWRPRSFRLLLAAALFLPALLAPTVLPAVPAQAATLGAFTCLPVNGLSTRFVNNPTDLLSGRLTIPGYRTVTIGTGRINWGMDPFGSSAWRKLFLSLKWVESLTDGYRRTGDRAYLDRAEQIVQDFVAHVPPDGGRFPPDAWNGMYAGQRATVLTCVESVAGSASWLRSAFLVYGRWLAANDPGDWNQGVNAAIGLLGVACRTGNRAWADLAQARFDRMARTTIDAEGAVGEQSTGYLDYLLGLWNTAADKLAECGRTVPAGLSTRLTAARNFLAWATTPAGTIEQLGDSTASNARVDDPNSALAYAVSRGAAGTAPPATSKLYSAGWIFGRSTWSPFATSMYWTQRFGPARVYHGHQDHLSLTLWDRGSPLVVDPGYATGRYRDWLIGPYAHNTTVAVGARFDKHAATPLTASGSGPGWFSSTMGDRAWDAAGRSRTTFVDADGHVVLVLDHARRTTPGGWQQLWHVPAGSAVSVRGRTTAVVDVPGGNARLHVLSPPLPGQELAPGAVGVVVGGSGQIAGRTSPRTSPRGLAPVVVVSRPVRTAAFLTVLVCGPPGSRATAAVRTTSGRTYVDVTVDGVRTTYRLTRSGFTR
jgi:hypothetical protein